MASPDTALARKTPRARAATTAARARSEAIIRKLKEIEDQANRSREEAEQVLARLS